MGITSPFFPDENCPQGDCASLQYNPRPDLNDATGEDVQFFADFMTFLGPPPRGPTTFTSLRGELIFAVIGCGQCHVPTLVTGEHPVPALNLWSGPGPGLGQCLQECQPPSREPQDSSS